MRTLIVDDSSIVRRRLAIMLEEMGQVTIIGQAPNMAEALGLIPSLRPDAVIVDLRMPDGDGIHLVEALKQLDNPPLVGVLTNYPYDQYRKRCLQAGADFFFDKTTEFARVPETLHRLSGGLRAP